MDPLDREYPLDPHQYPVDPVDLLVHRVPDHLDLSRVVRVVRAVQLNLRLQQHLDRGKNPLECNLYWFFSV